MFGCCSVVVSGADLVYDVLFLVQRRGGGGLIPKNTRKWIDVDAESLFVGNDPDKLKILGYESYERIPIGQLIGGSFWFGIFSSVFLIVAGVILTYIAYRLHKSSNNTAGGQSVGYYEYI